MVTSRCWLALFFIFFLFHLTCSEQGNDTKKLHNPTADDAKNKITSSNIDEEARMTAHLNITSTSNSNLSQLLVKPKHVLQELNKSKHDAGPSIKTNEVQDGTKNNISSKVETEEAGVDTEANTELNGDLKDNTESSNLPKNHTDMQQGRTVAASNLQQDRKMNEIKSNVKSKVIENKTEINTVLENTSNETQPSKKAGDIVSNSESDHNTPSTDEPENNTKDEVGLLSNTDGAQNYTEVNTESNEEKAEPEVRVEDKSKPEVIVKEPNEEKMINADEEERTVGNDPIDDDDDDDTVDGDNGELGDISEEHRYMEYGEKYADDGVEQQVEESQLHQKNEAEEINERGPSILKHDMLGRVDKQKSIYSTGTRSSAGANLFFYFVFFLVLCFALYILYHNKRKIRAMMGDGRRQTGSRWRGGGSNTGGKYQKLNTNETYLRSYH